MKATYRLLLFLFALVLMMASLNTCVLSQQQAVVTVRPAGVHAQNVLLLIDGKAVEAESLQIVRDQILTVGLRDLVKLGWGDIQSGLPGQTVFKSKSVTLTFIKGQGIALVNSLACKLPIDTYMKNERLMVPLSFVAKALGYNYNLEFKPVASITTTTNDSAHKGNNSISGSVTYNGKGTRGITVRVADNERNLIRNAIAKTNAVGDFEVSGLANGSYRIHILLGDNPSYFNRMSALVTVRDGQSVQIEPISLGRVINPISPVIGKTISKDTKRINFIWSPCSGTSAYEVKIKSMADGKTVNVVTSPEPKAQISTAKLKSGTAYVVEISATNIDGEYLGGTAGVGGTPWKFIVE